MTKKIYNRKNITKIKRKSTSLTPKIKESNQNQINANKSPNNNSLLEIMKRCLKVGGPFRNLVQ